MKRYISIAITLFALTSLTAQAIERHYVVRLKEWDGTETYSIMSKEEYTKQQKLMTEETRALSKAYREATKVWKTGEEYKDYASKSFPRSVMQKRELKIVKECRTREDADDTATKYEERGNQSSNRDERKLQQELRQAGKNTRLRAQIMKKYDAKRTREEDRMAIFKVARQCFEDELRKILKRKLREEDDEWAAENSEAKEEKKEEQEKKGGH